MIWSLHDTSFSDELEEDESSKDMISFSFFHRFIWRTTLNPLKLQKNVPYREFKINTSLTFQKLSSIAGLLLSYSFCCAFN